MTQKICSVCGKIKDIAEFPKDRSKKTGYASRCKICNRATCKRAYWQNAEKRKAENRERWERNGEAYHAQQKKWRRVNVEEIKAYQREYYRTNRNRILQSRKDNADHINARRRAMYQNDSEKAAAIVAKRRARISNNGGSFTIQEWADLKAGFDYRCLCCRKQEPEIKLAVDHIVSISSGGSSNIDNIQPLCKICNSSKGTRTIDYRGIFK